MLVDKIEAFHQHVYATLAALAYCVQLRRASSEDKYPIGSNSDFLKALAKRHQRFATVYLRDIEQLLGSTEYRSSWVDHLDRNPPYDWLTLTPEVESVRSYIVFFRRRGPGDIEIRNDSLLQRSLLSPFHPDFHPPFECESFKVAPDVDATYDALQRVVMAALRIDEPPDVSVTVAAAPPTASQNQISWMEV
jgi:hypothetical protein